MSKTKIISLYGVLIAVILLMSFTPLGYLKIGPVDITFLMIPVAVGAIMGGPVCGLILGGVFGITSFLQCFGMSPFGVALLAINPLAMCFTCIVPRILTGFLSGLVFQAMHRKMEKSIVPYLVSTVSAAVFNTVFFVSSVLIFFGNSDYIRGFGDTIIKIIFALVTYNAAIEIIACVIIGSAISRALAAVFEKWRIK